ncbi:hypothetical protein DERP_003442 [Dermatophagoides pteronyssinus]|uniref:Uncharacterized protein n=1 Tax=Dermatophagoides pteronyssinus TaxID=6956 RepID=A0ABQ8JJI1_DERPT|nr:hypothetical protein DERP_003442 [Dermatophagoides pteronyssinus]
MFKHIVISSVFVSNTCDKLFCILCSFIVKSFGVAGYVIDDPDNKIFGDFSSPLEFCKFCIFNDKFDCKRFGFLLTPPPPPPLQPPPAIVDGIVANGFISCKLSIELAGLRFLDDDDDEPHSINCVSNNSAAIGRLAGFGSKQLSIKLRHFSDNVAELNSMNGVLPVAISTTVQPNDQISAGAA